MQKLSLYIIEMNAINFFDSKVPYNGK